MGLSLKAAQDLTREWVVGLCAEPGCGGCFMSRSPVARTYVRTSLTLCNII